MHARIDRSENRVRIVFALLCVSLAIGTLAHLLGLGVIEAIATPVAGFSAVGFVILHGVCLIGVWRLAGFLAAAAGLGFCAELFSLRYGSLFGSAYQYPASIWHNLLLGVPVSVVAFWGVFIYGGYSIVNGFLFFVGAGKPRRGGSESPFIIPLLALADAFVVTAIDVYMDPINTLRGSWVWTIPGPFFGVPIGNFVGWFTVSFVASGLFRTYEYLWPRTVVPHRALTYVMPGLAYLMLLLVFTVYACSIHRLDIALAGLFAMGPVTVFTLIGYAFHNRAAGTLPISGNDQR